MGIESDADTTLLIRKRRKRKLFGGDDGEESISESLIRPRLALVMHGTYIEELKIRYMQTQAYCSICIKAIAASLISTMASYNISVPDNALARLKQKLALTTFPDEVLTPKLHPMASVY